MYCDKNFTKKANATRHQNSVHFIPKYQCQHCPLKFNRSDNLMKHVKVKHPKRKVPSTPPTSSKNVRLNTPNTPNTPPKAQPQRISSEQHSIRPYFQTEEEEIFTTDQDVDIVPSQEIDQDFWAKILNDSQPGLLESTQSEPKNLSNHSANKHPQSFQPEEMNVLEPEKEKNPSNPSNHTHHPQHSFQQEETNALEPEKEKNSEPDVPESDPQYANAIEDEFWEPFYAEHPHHPPQSFQQEETNALEPEKEKNSEPDAPETLSQEYGNPQYANAIEDEFWEPFDAEHRQKCGKCGKKYGKRWYSRHTCRKPQKVTTRLVSDQPPAEQNDKTATTKSAFEERLTTTTWQVRPIRKGGDTIICPLSALKIYRERIRNHLSKRLYKKKKPLRFYIIVFTTMERTDSDGIVQIAEPYFHGANRFLMNEHQLDEMIDESAQKINTAFEDYIAMGSGWRVKSINNIQVKSGIFTPKHGSSYIKTPACIIKKQAVVNILNTDDRCFEYAILASQNYHKLNVRESKIVNTQQDEDDDDAMDVDDDVDDDQMEDEDEEESRKENKKRKFQNVLRPQTYSPWLNTLNFDGCSIPMKINEIDKFEKKNNMAINIYTIKENAKTNSTSPLRISKKVVPITDYVNLLLIEGEKSSHYVWIRDFNRLMAKGDNHQRSYCLFCISPFLTRYGDEKFREHMSICRNYGGQKVILPPVGKNIIEFKDHHKRLKHPVAIYADFETFNVPVSGCEPNPNMSWTCVKTMHECSGFSFTVISDHFPQRTITYSKKSPTEDVGVTFLKRLFEEQDRIKKWQKENEKKQHDLSDEEEKQWNAETNCHICGELFLKSQDSHVSDKSFHLKEIKHLLIKNRLSENIIPSMKMVKKQKRLISMELHPDKQSCSDDKEKRMKENELKEFNTANEDLLAYLMNNNLDEEPEEDAEFTEEDNLSDEELERIRKKGWKVRDHDHWTGCYRGAAHSGCNLALRKSSKIPVIFHNLSGYDGHIIIKSVQKLGLKKPPKVVAKTMEKFVGFQIGKLNFMDSNQHLSSSLDGLVKNLAAKAKIIGCEFCPRRGPPKDVKRHQRIVHKKEFNKPFEHTIKSKTLPELFPNLHEKFCKQWKHLANDEDAFEMLTRKGVYPYRYMDSLEKFNMKQLPSKADFYNDLTKKHITDEDFTFVNKLWKKFGLTSMRDLHDIYMQTDTLLLSDVFENYRSVIHKNYGLDPVHYLTSPSLSWSAGLKYTQVKLEIPMDPDIHIFIDLGLRGGISMVANHYAKANNRRMGCSYNPETGESYIQFVDANNLYGWAMSQSLPTGNFKWVNRGKGMEGDALAINAEGENTWLKPELWTRDILNIKEDDPIGYIFKVDLEYPQHLRADPKHDNFPLAPESFEIKKQFLSQHQQTLGDELGLKYNAKKLCLTLMDKKDYICHGRYGRRKKNLFNEIIKILY